jgi:transposase-like protein
MVSFSGRHYPKFIILQCVRWHVVYALSYRNIEGMLTVCCFEINRTTRPLFSA